MPLVPVKGEGEELLFSCSEEDVSFALSRRWQVGTHGYVTCNKGLFHLLVLGKAPKGLEWDHRDGNKLNNRRENLEAVSHSENKRRDHERKRMNTSFEVKRDPKGFKLQIWIPWELHDQLTLIAGHGGDGFHGRIYGGLSRIVILALRQFLEQQPRVKPMNLEDI